MATIKCVFEPQTPQQPTDRINRFLNIVSRPISRPLTWLWKRGFRFLIILDAVALFLTMIGINLIRFQTAWPTYPLSHYMIGFATATGIHISVNYFAGLYEREAAIGSRAWLPRVSSAMLIGVGFDGLSAVLTNRYLMPRLNLGILLVVGTMVLTITRYLSRNLSAARKGPVRVAIIGPDDQRLAVRRSLESDGNRVTVSVEGVELSTIIDDLVSLEVSEVLILDLAEMYQAFPTEIEMLSSADIRIHQRISSLETLLGLNAVRQIAGMPFVRLRTNTLRDHQYRLKRVFDLLIIILTSPLWFPALLFLAVYVRLVAGRSVLFRQERIGQWGQPFTILKFRTMILDAEHHSGPQLSTRNDPRVVGKLQWLRGTRMDELPQLINVLRGEMSLVGPRPERPEFIDDISQVVVGYQRRHETKPGITGLAQVEGRYHSDAEHKLGYDIQYLVNWSIFLDIQVLLKTIWVVLTRRL